jgi:hypothetical protein
VEKKKKKKQNKKKIGERCFKIHIPLLFPSCFPLLLVLPLRVGKPFFRALRLRANASSCPAFFVLFVFFFFTQTAETLAEETLPGCRTCRRPPPGGGLELGRELLLLLLRLVSCVESVEKKKERGCTLNPCLDVVVFSHQQKVFDGERLLKGDFHLNE